MISGRRLIQKAARAVRILEEAQIPLPAWKLAARLGMDLGDDTNRDTRRVVAHISRAGIPVVGSPDGYRLARTPGEIAEYAEKLADQERAIRCRRKLVETYRRLFTRDGYDRIAWQRTGTRSGKLGRLLELMAGAEA